MRKRKRTAKKKSSIGWKINRSTKRWKEIRITMENNGFLQFIFILKQGKKQSQWLVVVADTLMGVQRGKQVKVRAQGETQCPLFLNSSSNMSSPFLRLNQ